MPAAGAFDARRFLEAQAPVYSHVISELRSGQKRSHWMWFIFPQIAGLGHSPTAQRFALSSVQDAASYLGNQTLGSRLVECTELVLAAKRPVNDIFGSPDNLKFCSSMTLFEAASPAELFTTALDRLCAGSRDQRTLSIIEPQLG